MGEVIYCLAEYRRALKKLAAIEQERKKEAAIREWYVRNPFDYNLPYIGIPSVRRKTIIVLVYPQPPPVYWDSINDTSLPSVVLCQPSEPSG